LAATGVLVNVASPAGSRPFGGVDEEAAGIRIQSGRPGEKLKARSACGR
jgi:hypothetical protein